MVNVDAGSRVEAESLHRLGEPAGTGQKRLRTCEVTNVERVIKQAPSR